MAKYKRTKRISTRTYTTLSKPPLDARSMIMRTVQAESEREYMNEFRPLIPDYRASRKQLKDGVGLFNFFRSNVVSFVMALRP